MADALPIRATLNQEIEDQEEQSPVSLVRIPGMIPSSMLTTKKKSELVEYLDEQLSIAEGERAPFIRKIKEWKVAYRAPMPKEPKHFPIFNASNLTIPVIKEAVNVLAAQLIQATLTARPRWIFKELHDEWEPFVDDIELFMDLASDRDLKLPKHAIPWLLETAKLGTGIIESGYEIDVRRFHRYSSDGLYAYAKDVVMADGPTLGYIPLDKFWIRFHEKGIQESGWCGKEFVLSKMELERFAKKNKLYGVEEVIASRHEATSNEVDRAMEEIEDTQPRTPTDKFKLFEIWLGYELTEDGPEEIKVYYEKTSRKLIGEFFHPFHHGKRPFVKLGYFPVEDRFYDEGLCEMLEQYQAAISATVNRRNDNASLANSKMILKKKIVTALKPGDPIYAGKIVETNDPYRDVREFSLGEIYPSTINEEQLLQGRAEKLAGVNEGVAGAAMPVTRTTAAAQLALLQEQAKRIDLAVKSVREGLNEIGQMTLSLYFQFGTGGKAYAWLGEKRGTVVEGIFRLPRALEELGMGITVNSPTSVQNRQVKRENKIALFNLLMQLHKELIPFAQMLTPEQLPVIFGSLVTSAHKYMVDVLETFEETDPEAVLAGIATLEKLLPRAEDLGGLESFTRGVERAETLDAISRLESSLAQARSIAERSRGVLSERGETRRVPAPEGLLGRYISASGVFPELEGARGPEGEEI